jgi:hypothetical protein
VIGQIEARVTVKTLGVLGVEDRVAALGRVGERRLIAAVQPPVVGAATRDDRALEGRQRLHDVGRGHRRRIVGPGGREERRVQLRRRQARVEILGRGEAQLDGVRTEHRHERLVLEI